jgi:hypothetical protein
LISLFIYNYYISTIHSIEFLECCKPTRGLLVSCAVIRQYGLLKGALVASERSADRVVPYSGMNSSRLKRCIAVEFYEDSNNHTASLLYEPQSHFQRKHTHIHFQHTYMLLTPPLYYMSIPMEPTPRLLCAALTVSALTVSNECYKSASGARFGYSLHRSFYTIGP